MYFWSIFGHDTQLSCGWLGIAVYTWVHWRPARSGGALHPSRTALPQAALARRLRQLREEHWPDVMLTQPELGRALGGAKPLSGSTISSWESVTSDAVPTASRLSAYATFFATRRSLAGKEPRMLPEDELTGEERTARDELKAELLRLRASAEAVIAETPTIAPTSTWHFPDGAPVRLFCGEIPPEHRSPWAATSHRNYTRLLSYADLDALLELFGHIRAQNPLSDVQYRLASVEPEPDDLSSHIVLLGGLAWNTLTGQLAREGVTEVSVPVQQISDDKLDGEVFVVPPAKSGDPPRRILPSFGDDGRLVHDVGLLARHRNPNNLARTLTICTGTFAPGVYGAVRALTDSRLRDGNERYLAARFPDPRRFALLFRVRVGRRSTLTPDLSSPSMRILDWPAAEAAQGLDPHTL